MRFVELFAKKVKAEELEVEKEENTLMLIDLFGCEKMLYSNFEETFYKTKLNILYTKNNNFLLKCKYCDKVFTNWRYNQSKILKCPASRNNSKFHQIDERFNPAKFITFIKRAYRVTWREIYWKVWSFINVF